MGRGVLDGRTMLPSRMFVVGLVVLAGQAPISGAAGAGDRPTPLPPGVAAVQQYVEDVPTARGAVAPTGGGTERAVLPVQGQRALQQAGPDAEILREVATSSAYGAPPTRPTRERPSERQAEVDALPSSAADAAVIAAADSVGAGLGKLVLVLIGATGAAVAAFAWRRRARRGGVT